MNTLSLRNGCAALALSALASMPTGCSGGGGQSSASDGSFTGCSNDPLAETYSAGMVATGKNGKLTAELVSSDPGPPIRGSNTWTVVVKDSAGAAVDGATFKVKPFMPHHNHGTQVVPVVTPMANGAYLITPLYLYMAGLWQTTLDITSSDGTTTDSVAFSFCIDD